MRSIAQQCVIPMPISAQHCLAMCDFWANQCAALPSNV